MSGFPRWRPISLRVAWRSSQQPAACRRLSPPKRRPRTYRSFFVTGSDPVEFRLVESLNRPGGNVTGIALLAYLLDAKRLQLLRDLVPSASRIAVLVNPTSAQTDAQVREVQAAVQAMPGELIVLQATSDNEFDSVFAAAIQQRAQVLLVSADPFFLSRRDRLVALAAKHAIPAAYQWREFAEAGGLVSYGTSVTDAYRQAAVYTGRILKGEKPADLPVQQSVKVELVINLKSAKALGLDVPTTLLARADEVIE
jgi:putative ABC transport system substrate-binding protein